MKGKNKTERTHRRWEVCINRENPKWEEMNWSKRDRKRWREICKTGRVTQLTKDLIPNGRKA